MLRHQDRIILQQTCDLARSERRPSERHGLPIEPTWAATVAKQDKIIGSDVFHQGDAEDAVRKIWKKIANTVDPVELTLYLTIEPRPTYQRLQPVTESVRATGIRRIIVGTEDPFHRLRGVGIQSLRNYGLDVTLADGEEGRSCQILYEDYAKVMNRFVPTLKILCELEEINERKIFNAKPYNGEIKVNFDGVLVDLASPFKRFEHLPKATWTILLDSAGNCRADHSAISGNLARLLFFTSETMINGSRVAEIQKKGITVIPISSKDGKMDLAIVMRKLRELGFLSFLCLDGQEIWRNAIRSGLVDAIICYVQQRYESTITLSHLASSVVTYQDSQFRLTNPRLLNQQETSFWIEADLQEKK